MGGIGVKAAITAGSAVIATGGAVLLAPHYGAKGVCAAVACGFAVSGVASSVLGRARVGVKVGDIFGGMPCVAVGIAAVAAFGSSAIRLTVGGVGVLATAAASYWKHDRRSRGRAGRDAPSPGEA